jgi:hypothetical protein
MITPAKIKNGIAKSENLDILAKNTGANICVPNPVREITLMAATPKETAIGTRRKMRTKKIISSNAPGLIPKATGAPPL